MSAWTSARALPNLYARHRAQMVSSRSYATAARSLSISAIGRSPAPISNKFINSNPLTPEEAIDVENSWRRPSKEWRPKEQTLVIKDNITTSDFPTTCGSAVLQSHISPFEATVVERLRSVGVQVKGKTNLDEFGMGSHSLNSFFGLVHSEHTKTPRSVGGSSGGSAIAVAQKLAHFALGTDTGGSVRLPAAYTGVVGFKPSYGLISRRGVVPYANSLDTVGILASSTQNLPDIFQHVRHHDALDPTSVTESAWERMNTRIEPSHNPSEDGYFASLTVGFPVEYNIEELEPAIRHTWMKTLALLRERGCKVVPVSLPSTKHALSAYYVLAPAEAGSNLSKYDGVRYGTRNAEADGGGHVLYSETRGKGFGPEVQRRILLGSYTLSATAIDNYFIKAQKVRRLVQRDFNRVFKQQNPLCPPEQFDISDMHESIPLQDKLGPAQVDFILCPTAPTQAPTISQALGQTGVDSYMNDVFTVPASLAGLPAVSLPCQISKKYHKKRALNLAGIQIIGQYGDDLKLLEMATQLEKALEIVDPNIKRASNRESVPTTVDQDVQFKRFDSIPRIRVEKDLAKQDLGSKPNTRDKSTQETTRSKGIHSERSTRPLIRKFMTLDPETYEPTTAWRKNQFKKFISDTGYITDKNMVRGGRPSAAKEPNVGQRRGMEDRQYAFNMKDEALEWSTEDAEKIKNPGGILAANIRARESSDGAVSEPSPGKDPKLPEAQPSFFASLSKSLTK